MIHVVFVCPDLSIGGSQRRLVRYANGLVARNYSVTIIITGSCMSLAGEISSKVVLIKLNSRFLSPKCWWRLCKVLRSLDPNILFGWSLYSNFLVCMLSPFVNCRLIVSEVNYPPLEYLSHGRFAYVILRILTLLYRRADVITANSDPSLEVLKKWLGPRPKYIRVFNPIDHSEISQLADEPIVHCEIPEDETVILAVGRIEIVHKGFDLLLEALAKPECRDQRWTGIIVGSGPDESRLLAQAVALEIGDRLVWCGAQANPFPYFKRADIFVLPSRREGFPNALLEAMSLGKAVVATDCMAGPREMTDNGRCGLLVPVDDSGALARAVVRLLKDPAERRFLGALAKQRIAETYSEGKVFNCLISALNGAEPR